jgi:hypothetical protein
MCVSRLLRSPLEGKTLRDEVLDRGVYRRALQRLEVGGQAWRLCRCARHGGSVGYIEPVSSQDCEVCIADVGWWG